MRIDNMTESNYEQALEHIQNQEFHQALKKLDSAHDTTLYAEVERLAYTSDAISNYADRLIEELAKKISEKGVEEG
jgi:hypothetical protein